MTEPRNRWQISLRFALAIVAFVAIGTRWWQTVPDRTVSRFADAIVERNAASLAAQCPSCDILAETWRLNDEPTLVYEIENKPRDVQDFVRGRGSFEIRFYDGSGRKQDVVHVDVLRYRAANAYSAMPISRLLIADHARPTGTGKDYSRIVI